MASVNNNKSLDTSNVKAMRVLCCDTAADSEHQKTSCSNRDGDNILQVSQSGHFPRRVSLRTARKFNIPDKSKLSPSGWRGKNGAKINHLLSQLYIRDSGQVTSSFRPPKHPPSLHTNEEEGWNSQPAASSFEGHREDCQIVGFQQLQWVPSAGDVIVAQSLQSRPDELDKGDNWIDHTKISKDIGRNCEYVLEQHLGHYGCSMDTSAGTYTDPKMKKSTHYAATGIFEPKEEHAQQDNCSNKLLQCTLGRTSRSRLECRDKDTNSLSTRKSTEQGHRQTSPPKSIENRDFISDMAHLPAQNQNEDLLSAVDCALEKKISSSLACSSLSTNCGKGHDHRIWYGQDATSPRVEVEKRQSNGLKSSQAGQSTPYPATSGVQSIPPTSKSRQRRPTPSMADSSRSSTVRQPVTASLARQIANLEKHGLLLQSPNQIRKSVNVIKTNSDGGQNETDKIGVGSDQSIPVCAAEAQSQTWAAMAGVNSSEARSETKTTDRESVVARVVPKEEDRKDTALRGSHDCSIETDLATQDFAADSEVPDWSIRKEIDSQTKPRSLSPTSRCRLTITKLKQLRKKIRLHIDSPSVELSDGECQDPGERSQEPLSFEEQNIIQCSRAPISIEHKFSKPSDASRIQCDAPSSLRHEPQWQSPEMDLNASLDCEVQSFDSTLTEYSLEQLYKGAEVCLTDQSLEDIDERARHVVDVSSGPHSSLLKTAEMPICFKSPIPTDYFSDAPLLRDEMSVMAMLIKPFAHSSLGIELFKPHRDGWRIVISHLDRHGLLGQSDLRAGQTILAVNGISASSFTTAEAVVSTLEVSRKVVIVATKSIMCWVGPTLHSDEDTRSPGIVLGVHYEPDAHNSVDTPRNAVIKQLSSRGPFSKKSFQSICSGSGGILEKGMKIIALNEKTNPDLYEANRILREYQNKDLAWLRVLAVDVDNCNQSLDAEGNKAPLGQATEGHNHLHEIVASSKSLSVYLEESSVMALVRMPRSLTSDPGIAFQKRSSGDSRILISKIDANGIFGKTSLRVGQTLLAVNGTPASYFSSAEQVVALIESKPRPLGTTEDKEIEFTVPVSVSIVATKSILATVHKKSASTRVGIAFCQSKRNSHFFNSGGVLTIHQIATDGLFDSNGLLHVGMKVVAINGKPCPVTLEAANDTVRKCVGPLTIVAVAPDEMPME